MNSKSLNPGATEFRPKRATATTANALMRQIQEIRDEVDVLNK